MPNFRAIWLDIFGAEFYAADTNMCSIGRGHAPALKMVRSSAAMKRIRVRKSTSPGEVKTQLLSLTIKGEVNETST
jgi:hypothetical protein